MKLQVSDKVASIGKKPKIKKGYYRGVLQQVKPRQDKDGNWVESKFGRQIILLFHVFNQDGSKVMNPEQPSEQLVLGQVLNSEYRNEDGSYRTAVTQNSRITKVFTALGWSFSTEGVDTDSLIGNSVELNIDDYEATDSDGNKYKASSIKDINKWEGEEPSTPSPTKEEKPKKEISQEEPKTEDKPKLSDDKQKRIDQMKKMKDDRMLSEDGYKKAVEQIENE